MISFSRWAIAAIALLLPVLVGAQGPQPAAAAFDRLKSMGGELRSRHRIGNFSCSFKGLNRWH